MKYVWNAVVRLLGSRVQNEFDVDALETMALLLGMYNYIVYYIRTVRTVHDYFLIKV